MPENNRQLLLSDMNTGDHATILAFQGGRAVVNRLASLGFTPGAQVDMSQNYGRGPLIVTVRGMRVALGRGEADNIVVSRGAHD
ncbi:MAG TPA: FeoA family protein [Anaerolineaceae bacterium]|nr:FeoA family protein [Anaerolineaceae bacterium]HNS36717.1 FeoA family protein [Anaerolineaceae bacterium]HOD03979.1 FeoA family protein [Anaerolineaceae bacterium]HOG80362.1 FeoA family protein [Anaerolineaceae bacterium]HQF63985.1 FeoA family protein [Anaerolineaceae bacterium]